MIPTVTIKIQVKDFGLEVSGEQNFATQKFADLFEQYYQKTAVATSSAHNKTSDTEQTATMADNGSRLSNESPVFGLSSEGAVEIYSSIPDGSKADKTKNVALIVCFAKEGQWVASSEIAEACKNQSCFDSSNFAATLKSCQDLQKKGNGTKREYKITVPGTNRAKELLAKMEDIVNG